mgnify:CR=1 FL=1
MPCTICCSLYGDLIKVKKNIPNKVAIENENNKRIAKNTMYLYIRMLFSLLVGLYTSRVVLQTLGISDYGLYNVVGGFVSIFMFINGTMVRSVSYRMRLEKEI